MWSSRRLMAVAVMMMLGTAVQGCRTGSPFDEDAEATDTRVHLNVKNETINEMDIYAVADGLATRIGSVSGLASKSFSIEQSFSQASDFRIVGAPIGGNGRASTGPVIVSRGQTIDFTIRTNLRASTFSIH